jgi:hypothetical protein
MLAKIIGALLLAAGAVLALKFVGVVATGVIGFALVLLKAGLVAALIWWGWALINRPSALPKILGAFVMVGGMLLSIPLFGLLVIETVALMWMAAKVAVVAVLLYGGWSLLNRDNHFTQRA